MKKESIMGNLAGTIIKNKNAILDGAFQLQTGKQPQKTQSHQTHTVVAPQVCIAENNPECVVLEITCSCGQKTYVKCEYANT